MIAGSIRLFPRVRRQSWRWRRRSRPGDTQRHEPASRISGRTGTDAEPGVPIRKRSPWRCSPPRPYFHAARPWRGLVLGNILLQLPI